METKQEEKKCFRCNGSMHLVKAGISKRTGQPYDDFWACDNRDCKPKPKNISVMDKLNAIEEKVDNLIEFFVQKEGEK